MAWRTLVILVLGGAAMSGCVDDKQKRIVDLESKLDVSERKVAAQARELIAREEAVRSLQKQLQTLSGLNPERRAGLPVATRIELAAMSGGYDRDGQPGDDGVVVYVQPYDADGDVVKSGGAVQVQVLDLANPSGQQLVCEYRWTPAELRKQWYGRLMTQHYTLRCPWSKSGPPRHANLTVRVVFYELLAGAALEKQQVVTVKVSQESSPAAAKE